MQEAENESDKAKKAKWLYLEEGRIPLIRRLTGLAFLPVLLLTIHAIHVRFVPYSVPTWRFGDFLLALPIPPEPFNLVCYVGAGLCGLALVFGARQRFFVIMPALFLLYFGSAERGVLWSHFTVINLVTLIALCFHRDGSSSPTRRILQLMISTCYGFAVLARLTSPTHLSGTTFKLMVGSGYSANALFSPLMQSLYDVDWLWPLLSWLVLVTELFLVFGFYFGKTRRLAFVLGVLLHLGIAVTLNTALALFSLVMITGYLAFLDGAPPTKTRELAGDATAKVEVPSNRQEADESRVTATDSSIDTTVDSPASRPSVAKAERQEPGMLQTTLALAFIALLFIIPLRVYCWPDRPIATLCTSDKDPWSFHMFIIFLQPDLVTARFQDSKEEWHDFQLTDRMKIASSDNELYCLAAHIFETEPDARRVEIDARLKLNDWYQYKHATAERPDPSRLRITVRDEFLEPSRTQ